MSAPVLRPAYSGKVRDLYDVDGEHLLMVASDRISVYDVVLDDPIPDKGRVLTALSAYWFEQTAAMVENHFVTADPGALPDLAQQIPDGAGRTMLVRRTDPVRLECVARGYLFGSAWSDYEATGAVYGVPFPPGMRRAERLAQPIFTATTKAPVGTHDEALTTEEASELVGPDVLAELREHTLALYSAAAAHAEERGIILADTKFEFGRLDGRLVLIDECFTPDSSRYWPADAWAPGADPPSFDKQYVRDYVDHTGWDHTPPAPRLPDAVVRGTRGRYVEAYERMTGRRFADWYR